MMLGLLPLQSECFLVAMEEDTSVKDGDVYSSCSGGLRPLVELCVEPAGLCGRCTGVAVPLRVASTRDEALFH